MVYPLDPTTNYFNLCRANIYVVTAIIRLNIEASSGTASIIWKAFPPHLCSPLFCFFTAGNSETRSPWRSPRASTWMPEWPRFITFDLSETGVPAPERCVVPRCSPDVWIDYLLLKTGETWQGRSPKREQNKESDFTDPLSIKHLRSTIALALPTGIPAASKGNVWGIFPCFWTWDCRRSVFIVLCCCLTQPEDVAKTVVH